MNQEFVVNNKSMINVLVKDMGTINSEIKSQIDKIRKDIDEFQEFMAELRASSRKEGHSNTNNLE